MLRFMNKAEGQNPQNGMEESESSRALLNPRSPWTTAMPGASLAEMEHTGAVSLCPLCGHPQQHIPANWWPRLFATLQPYQPSKKGQPGLSSSDPSLPLSAATPGSVWSSCALLALLDAPSWALLLLPCSSPAHPHQRLPGCSNPSPTLI